MTEKTQEAGYDFGVTLKKCAHDEVEDEYAIQLKGDFAAVALNMRKLDDMEYATLCERLGVEKLSPSLQFRVRLYVQPGSRMTDYKVK